MPSRFARSICIALLLGGCDRSDPATPPVPTEPVAAPVDPALESKPIPQPAPTPTSERSAAGSESSMIVEQIIPGLVQLESAALTEVGLDLAQGRVVASIVSSAHEGGAHLETVAAGSVIDRVGLAAGDIVSEINGVAILDIAGLREAFARSVDNGRLVLRYRRGTVGSELEILLTHGDKPSRAEALATFTALVGHGTNVQDERRRTIDRALLQPLSRHAGTMPLEDLWRRLGIPADLKVKLVGGQEVLTASNRSFAFASIAAPAVTDGGRTFEITAVDDDGKTIVFEFEVIDGAITPEAVERATAGLSAPPLRGRRDAQTDPGASTDPDPDAETETETVAGVEGLTCSDAGRCSIERTAFDRLFAAPQALARQARIIPHYVDGNADGFKLFGVRPRSVLKALGFKNGDVLRSINGRSIATPDEALAAYTKLREAETLTFLVERRGQDENIVLQILP